MFEYPKYNDFQNLQIYIISWTIKAKEISIFECPKFTEAQRLEQINQANGEAAAMIAVAEARATGLNIIAKSWVESQEQT